MSSSPCVQRFSDELPSSPPPHVTNTGSRKLKKPPPITPKRFQKFFTPRTSTHRSSAALSRSGRQLQDITRAALNRSSNASHRTTPRKTVNFADIDVENNVQTPQLSSRKRKTPYLSPESSPAQSSPTKRHKFTTPPPFTILEDAPEFDEPPVPIFPEPIRRLKSLGGTARKLTRSFGGILAVDRGLRRDHCASWQDYTTNFYTSSEDYHDLPQGAPPFCTATCNANSLVAVGDEDGWVHILDAEDETPSSFSKAHVSWRAHGNAVMDIQFSSDDKWIATGSGDQTGQIIDARTQQTVQVLAKHKSSVKQIRFQPGDDNIIATSSRDGAVQIWDLRCKGGHTTVHPAWGEDVPYAHTVKSLTSVHADHGIVNPTTKTGSTGKGEVLSRRNDISITALSFLPTGRQHLLLTASDASTSVKLWDIRGRYSLRGPAVPISTTRHPESHTRHRHFAINSLTLSTDAARLYALSKDNTVYAYATSHLILGVAPELAPNSPSKTQRAQQEGLGPIYGFRHRNFHAGSFYVKAALRPASNAQPELLAVGSTDGCPVLFPTDESFLRRDPSDLDNDDNDLPSLSLDLRRSSRLSHRNPPSSFSSSAFGGQRFPNLLADTVPIYEHGTPLIRGHDAEVTSVSFTREGKLISVGDDLRVRRWKEGGRARELRLGGEAEGKRWGCGWAVVSEGFDDEE